MLRLYTCIVRDVMDFLLGIYKQFQYTMYSISRNSAGPSNSVLSSCV